MATMLAVNPLRFAPSVELGNDSTLEPRENDTFSAEALYVMAPSVII